MESIENVIQANELAAITPKENILTELNKYFTQGKLKNKTQQTEIVYDVFNVAFVANIAFS